MTAAMRLFTLSLMVVVSIGSELDGKGEGLFVLDVPSDNKFIQECTTNSTLLDHTSKFNRNLVLFYSSMCGHCQQYAPVYRKIAAHVHQHNAAPDSDKIGVTAVNCDQCRDFCTAHEVQTVPVIKLFHGPAAKNTAEVLENDSFEFVIKHLGLSGEPSIQSEELDVDQEDDYEEDPYGEEDGMELTLPALDLKEKLKRDIMTAVQYGFEQGVFLGRQKLVGPELNALNKWLDVLVLSLPGSRERESVQQVHDGIETLVQEDKGELNSYRWDQIVAKWRKQASLAGYDIVEHEYKWYMCPEHGRHGDTHGGYNCAMWLLLHTLSVSSATGGATPRATVNGVLSFIGNFFSCQECKKNFMRNNKNVGDRIDVDSWEEVILWLWMEHNSVNERLTIERPTKHTTRIQFPDPMLCTSCRFEGNIEELAKPATSETDQEEDDVWNKRNILQFLVATYCFNDEALNCVISHSDFGLQEYIITTIFLVLCIAFVLLRFVGKRLNKKLH